MPRVTIFVRDEDFDGFEAISNRPAWVHNAIKYRGPLEMGTTLFSNLPDDGKSHSIKPDIPTQVNPKSHGPTVEPTTYIDESEMM